jgi:hypothetical protein
MRLKACLCGDLRARDLGTENRERDIIVLCGPLGEEEHTLKPE